ncbi:MAG: hypothetical protein CVU88_06050 [Firmicutes bacterium HGW-Firmicutes-13]|nr:MAG: hypothetical protein CVU88_06050 [Firmicutes bacterium HGW-Firmicutes-13]
MEKHKWRFSHPLNILVVIAFLLLFLFIIAFLINWQVGVKEKNRSLVLQDNPQVRYSLVFKTCGHQVEQPSEILPENISSIKYSGLSSEDLKDKLPMGWVILSFSPAEVIMEKLVDDLCYECKESSYVGIFEDRIAIYQGKYPYGVLKEITDFEVKEVYRQELEKGIPFSTEEEKRRILESYTS